MHATSFSSPDLNWFLHLVFTLFVLALGLRHLLKNTASKYLVVNAGFYPSSESHPSTIPSSYSPLLPSTHLAASMPGVHVAGDSCAVCGRPAPKKCSRCKAVMYCSTTCQSEHWKSGHKLKCRPQSSSAGGKNNGHIALVPSTGFCKTREQFEKVYHPEKVLFPYGEFVKLFGRDFPGLPPCGLLNCGNSCFANVVLQCLVHTRPLLAYLLDSGHKRGCRRNGWCFLCELQMHAERACGSQHPFSPINILSRLPSLGGNLGYGKQEDAHEFMRFAIDTMQSVFLDEHGGEKVLHPKSQATTLIQHIFGGQLQSQVICTECKQVSNQYEYMMDLTLEIQGDATSLEECLEQFTGKEWLHGDNMYKCDRCDDYVTAWKRLSVHQAPNILTIALKRFQSGRFGKLNKRITFPENLDLSSYMSDSGDGTDKYKLYAVVVHVDMLNASFFGHYICYTKDFLGNWYRVDDCKVMRVELDEVLSQTAYMLFYSRVSARPTCLGTSSSPAEQEKPVESSQEAAHNCVEQLFNSSTSLDGDPNCQPCVNVLSNNLHLQTVPFETVSEFLAQDADNLLQPLNPESSALVPVHIEEVAHGDDVSDRIPSPAEHCQMSSFVFSLNEKSSNFCTANIGASTSGSCVDGISTPEYGQLALHIPMDLDFTFEGLAPDRASPASSNGTPSSYGAVDKFNSDMPLSSHIESPSNVEKDAEKLRVNDSAEVHGVNGNCNRFGPSGDHDSATASYYCISFEDGQCESCSNDVDMDVHLSGSINLCDDEANCGVLDEGALNRHRHVAAWKIPSCWLGENSNISDGPDMNVRLTRSVSVWDGERLCERASDGGYPASTEKMPSLRPGEDSHISNGPNTVACLSRSIFVSDGESNGTAEGL
ncbi:hypothetical protein Dimus_010845 [Dionaea muscipula]